MRTECPHCFTEVIPTAANQCPACRKPLTGSPNTEFTKATIRGSDLPAGLCLKCGSPTQGRRRIHKTCKNVNYTPGGDRLAGHPIALFLNFLAGKHRQSVTVIISVCDRCLQSGPIEPHYIDFDAKTMTFIGHKTWVTEVLRLRQQPS